MLVNTLRLKEMSNRLFRVDVVFEASINGPGFARDLQQLANLP